MSSLADFSGLLLSGALLTIAVSAWSIVGSFLVGVVVGCVGNSGARWLRIGVRLSIEAMRNVPVLIKIVFLYLLVGTGAFASVVIALVLHHGAYMADNVLSGFRGIPPEQRQASFAMGHTPIQTFFWVLLPQALLSTTPTFTTQFIEVVKNSALALVVGLPELAFQIAQIESDTFKGFEAAMIATVIYLSITLSITVGMSILSSRLRRRLGRT